MGRCYGDCHCTVFTFDLVVCFCCKKHQMMPCPGRLSVSSSLPLSTLSLPLSSPLLSSSGPWSIGSTAAANEGYLSADGGTEGPISDRCGGRGTKDAEVAAYRREVPLWCIGDGENSRVWVSMCLWQPCYDDVIRHHIRSSMHRFTYVCKMCDVICEMCDVI